MSDYGYEDPGVDAEDFTDDAYGYEDAGYEATEELDVEAYISGRVEERISEVIDDIASQNEEVRTYQDNRALQELEAAAQEETAMYEEAQRTAQELILAAGEKFDCKESARNGQLQSDATWWMQYAEYQAREAGWSAEQIAQLQTPQAAANAIAYAAEWRAHRSLTDRMLNIVGKRP